MLHTIPPVFDSNSKVLILGSFPSVKSRETQFFYGNPQNRFWRVIARLLNCGIPETAEEKRAMLLKNSIALWDVVQSCEIKGSDDSTIRKVVPNDLSVITSTACIKKIFTNGGTANRLYKKYCQSQTEIQAVPLPSTSPANAKFGFDELVEAWSVILKP